MLNADSKSIYTCFLKANLLFLIPKKKKTIYECILVNINNSYLTCIK